MYKTDYHIHSSFSDGRASPDEYISPAIAAGIKEIGFSEHISLYKPDQHWCMDPGNVGNYIDHVDGLRRRLDTISVKTGLEIDYIPGKEKEIDDFLSALDLDYRIGSVHYLGENTVDMGEEFYKGKDIDKLYELYFDHVIAAAASGLFDIIGHCDLIRIYGYKPLSDPSIHYRKLAAALKKHDVAFEINTNGKNKPLADFYPDRRFLQIFSSEKIPVCVNSDAHVPSRVAQYFSEAYDLLAGAGFTEMAVFNKRERTMMPI
jgi:histidinol-phosphatase (PHP family)